MPITRFLTFLLCLCAVLPAIPQTLPQQVTVDPWLTLTFPGKVTHYDSLGVDLFQTSVNNTTYQLVKRAHVFQQASADQRSGYIDEAARLMMGNSKFNGLTKQVSDSVIGGSKGRFVQISNDDATKPYRVFIFVTIQDTHMYSLQCASFNPLTKCVEDVHYFYSHVVFGLQRVPAKQPQ